MVTVASIVASIAVAMASIVTSVTVTMASIAITSVTGLSGSLASQAPDGAADVGRSSIRMVGYTAVVRLS